MEREKRTPKVSPKVVALKIPAKKKSPQRLVDEPVLNPTDLIQQGVDLMKMTLDDFVKQSEGAKAAKEAANEAETSAKNVEAEGVVESDPSETKPEYDTSKLGVGKTKLKFKPQKKKKGSDKEDATYIPTPEEKKKVIRKRKAIPTGVIPRSVRARKGAATIPEIQSVKAREVEKHVETTSIPEVKKDQSVEKPEEESKKAPESPIFERVEKNDEDEVEFMGERPSTPPPPPPVNPTIHIPVDPKEPPSAKKATTSSSSQGFPTFPDNLGPGPISLDDVGDLFNEGKINLLTKRVSLLEKAKAKAEAERDELKEKLEKMKAENAELKKAVIDHADRIDELTDDYKDQAKVIDRITAEFDEMNEKYELMSETNKTLHQMIGELHESSSNENKILRQEIEA
ncbi:neurofilament medium polypeptide-like [Helianthus annuus]|uniref:neurofilament medium polypeptide-like n=1 Tax=Helianthus annuus TaxID=4232 RepID=UPI000B901763|nr:neurofilament medium polypeptide-like [Helianthus annuus]